MGNKFKSIMSKISTLAGMIISTILLIDSASGMILSTIGVELEAHVEGTIILKFAVGFIMWSLLEQNILFPPSKKNRVKDEN